MFNHGTTMLRTVAGSAVLGLALLTSGCGEQLLEPESAAFSHGGGPDRQSFDLGAPAVGAVGEGEEGGIEVDVSWSDLDGWAHVSFSLYASADGGETRVEVGGAGAFRDFVGGETIDATIAANLDGLDPGTYQFCAEVMASNTLKNRGRPTNHHSAVCDADAEWSEETAEVEEEEEVVE